MLAYHFMSVSFTLQCQILIKDSSPLLPKKKIHHFSFINLLLSFLFLVHASLYNLFPWKWEARRLC